MASVGSSPSTSRATASSSGSSGSVGDLLPLVADDSDPLGVEGLATHHLPLDDAPWAYEAFHEKKDGAIKIVLRP